MATISNKQLKEILSKLVSGEEVHNSIIPLINNEEIFKEIIRLGYIKPLGLYSKITDSGQAIFEHL
jgi:hypothetical protein